MADVENMDDVALQAHLDQVIAELDASVDAYTFDPSPENIARTKQAQVDVVEARSTWRKREEAAGRRSFLTITDEE